MTSWWRKVEWHNCRLWSGETQSSWAKAKCIPKLYSVTEKATLKKVDLPMYGQVIAKPVPSPTGLAEQRSLINYAGCLPQCSTTETYCQLQNLAKTLKVFNWMGHSPNAQWISLLGHTERTVQKLSEYKRDLYSKQKNRKIRRC